MLFPASNLICTPSKKTCPLSNLIVLVIPSTNIVESSPTSVPFIVPSNVPSKDPVWLNVGLEGLNCDALAFQVKTCPLVGASDPDVLTSPKSSIEALAKAICVSTSFAGINFVPFHFKTWFVVGAAVVISTSAISPIELIVCTEPLIHLFVAVLKTNAWPLVGVGQFTLDRSLSA